VFDATDPEPHLVVVSANGCLDLLLGQIVNSDLD